MEQLISIVIPVYNAASYLPDTIRSVEKQTYTDWELICVDDASTDESLSLLYDCKKKWEQEGKQNKIKVFSLPKNQGPAVARNTGIRVAKGRYLAFLDADDIWDSKKLEKQYQFLTKHDYAFTFTGYEFADKTAKRNGKVVHVPHQIKYQEALKNTTISTITVLFDRSKIPDTLLFMPEDCAREDTATWWKILRNGYTAYGLDEALSVYRRHKASHSSNKWHGVKGTWNMYRRQEGFSILKSARYMSVNLLRAVKRRL